MRFGGPTRDWTDARAKVDAEGQCRNCGRKPDRDHPLEAAHVSGREFDDWAPCKTCNGSGRNLAKSGPCRFCKGSGASSTRYVHPDDVVPLCGPVGDSSTCHAKDHSKEIDLIGILKPHEEARAVIHLDGLENARVRLAPSAYRETA